MNSTPRKNWVPKKLNELGYVGRGKSKCRPRNDPSLYGGEYPFIQTGEIKAVNLYISDYVQTYNDKGLSQSKLWPPQTLCITIAANIAETAILKIPACFPDSVVGFITDPQKADVRFIKYSFEVMKSRMQNISGGTTQDNFSLDKLSMFDFFIPSLPTQRKIAAVLSAYDDLIENNLRRIKILEETAQNLYTEWFVKFRFPGHEKVKMVDLPLGRIPEGWYVGKLNDVLITIESGSRPKGGIDAFEREIPSIGAENILGLGEYDYLKDKFVSKDFFNRMTRGHIKHRDVLLYKDGAQIGRKAMFGDGFPHSVCCINEHVFILRVNNQISQSYLYFWLDQPEMTQNIKNLNANSAQPGINQVGVKALPILIPTKEIIVRFDELCEPLLSELFLFAKENNILRKTRNLLLPRLISGELNVSNLDIKIGDNE